MLLPYFVAALKPVALGQAVPLSRKDFMARARDSLSGALLNDLELLDASFFLAGNEDAAVRRDFFRKGISQAKTGFLRAFLKEALNIYEVLAGLVAKRDKMPREAFLSELRGSFDSTASMIERFYEDEYFKLRGRHNFIISFKEALSDPDPIVMEREISTALIVKADEIKGNEQLGEAEVLAYFIRLIICERFLSFNEERGREILAMLINKVRQGAAA